jgi:hypothetical protein
MAIMPGAFFETAQLAGAVAPGGLCQTSSGTMSACIDSIASTAALQ